MHNTSIEGSTNSIQFSNINIHRRIIPSVDIYNVSIQGGYDPKIVVYSSWQVRYFKTFLFTILLTGIFSVTVSSLSYIILHSDCVWFILQDSSLWLCLVYLTGIFTVTVSGLSDRNLHSDCVWFILQDSSLWLCLVYLTGIFTVTVSGLSYRNLHCDCVWFILQESSLWLCLVYLTGIFTVTVSGLSYRNLHCDCTWDLWYHFDYFLRNHGWFENVYYVGKRRKHSEVSMHHIVPT